MTRNTIWVQRFGTPTTVFFHTAFGDNGYKSEQHEKSASVSLFRRHTQWPPVDFMELFLAKKM